MSEPAFQPQQPFPPQPPVPVYDLPYYGVPAESPDRLPTSAKAIGIIGTILGSIGVLGLLFVALMAIAMVAAPQAGAAIRRSNAMATSPVQLGLGIVGGIVAVAELAGSIGLLRRAEWGRRLMVLWALVEPALAVVATVVALAYVIPQTLAKLPPTSGVPPTMMAPFLYVSTGIGLLLRLILPAFALVYLRRPNVRAACNAGSTGR